MRRQVDVEDLWEQYAATRSREARDKLIIQYAPLVTFVASRLAAGLPQSVEQAELAGNGMFGLVDAIEKFEPGRGNRFESYAMARIRGAILDELRSFDWVPRSVRSKARQLEKAYTRFEAEHHRAPNDQELADLLDLEVDQVRTLLAKVSMTGLVALDEMLGGADGGDESVSLVDVLPSGVDTPDDVLGDEATRTQLAAEIEQLPEREKTVLALYYYEGMTLAEIGDVLGVTESRICQIHTKSVLHLRQRMAAADRADRVSS